MKKESLNVRRAVTVWSALLESALVALLWPAMAAGQQAPGHPASSHPAADGRTPVELAQAPTEPRGKAPAAPKAQAKGKTPPAESRQVNVNVLMLSDKVANNPDEFHEARGLRYIYFNSPRLAAPARPLLEPKPLFPTEKLDRQDGAVILQLLIDEEGNQEASVVCAARGFENSALESVKELKFQPARDKNGPVRSYMLVEFGYGRGFPCIPAPYY
jgi:outer membrane biosynthesis protein TonB